MGKNTPAANTASITNLDAAAEQQAQAEETTVNTTTANVEKVATEETSKGSGKSKKAAARPCLGMAGAVAARTYHIMFSPTRRR